MKGFKDWHGTIEGLPWYKYKILLHKRYFDIGRGKTSDVKYFIAIYGAYSVIEKIHLSYLTLILTAYLIFCYFFGWLWVKYKWYEAEIEIGNQYNPFVKETRRFINK